MRVSNIEAMRSQIKGKHNQTSQFEQAEPEQHHDTMTSKELFRQSSNALFASGA